MRFLDVPRWLFAMLILPVGAANGQAGDTANWDRFRGPNGIGTGERHLFCIGKSR